MVYGYGMGMSSRSEGRSGSFEMSTDTGRAVGSSKRSPPSDRGMPTFPGYPLTAEQEQVTANGLPGDGQERRQEGCHAPVPYP